MAVVAASERMRHDNPEGHGDDGEHDGGRGPDESRDSRENHKREHDEDAVVLPPHFEPCQTPASGDVGGVSGLDSIDRGESRLASVVAIEVVCGHGSQG